jgi:hypothetical protein
VRIAVGARENLESAAFRDGVAATVKHMFISMYIVMVFDPLKLHHGLSRHSGRVTGTYICAAIAELLSVPTSWSVVFTNPSNREWSGLDVVEKRGLSS